MLINLTYTSELAIINTIYFGWFQCIFIKIKRKMQHWWIFKIWKVRWWMGYLSLVPLFIFRKYSFCDSWLAHSCQFWPFMSNLTLTKDDIYSILNDFSLMVVKSGNRSNMSWKMKYFHDVSWVASVCIYSGYSDWKETCFYSRIWINKDKF